MKRTLLITLILLAVTMIFAQEQMQRATRNAFPQNTRSRAEVVAWQATFEDGTAGWTTSPTTAANLWHIAPVADAPSPVNAMINQNASGSYNSGMSNYLYSPMITLPLSGAIRADFQLKGDFTDNTTPPTSSTIDYWSWQISPNNGTNWYYMSNPYGTLPNTQNFIFIDAPTEWGFVTESYSSLSGLISDYAGMTVKFRILFKSDGDTPIGTGIMIDNFTIFNEVYLPEPTNLAGEISEQSVNLNWIAPPSNMSSETITSTNSAWSSFVSDADAYAMKVTNPFNTPLQLRGVKFMLYRMNSAAITGAPTVSVYADAAGLPGDELVSVTNVANIQNQVWKEVNVSSGNIMIPALGSVFVGISGIDDGGSVDGQGMLCDSTSVSADSYALMEGSWDLLGVAYDGLKNCALAGTYWVDDPFAPTLTGFKVYRTISLTEDFTEIATIPSGSTITYTDATPVIGAINYYKVTAMFDQYESEASNVFSIDLISLLYTELMNDDGVSNQTYNVGSTNYMTTKFNTFPNAELNFAKVYINSVGSTALLITVFDADGADGLPGTSLYSFTTAVSNLTVGWNNLPIPEANILADPDGVFYISIRELFNSSVYALDTDSSGRSYKKIGSSGAWTPITEGNVMIRALVRWDNGTEDMTEIAPISELSNYPNPFNSNTSISFNLQKSGTADLKIYNLKGQLVRTLNSGNIAKGTKSFTWDGTDTNGKNVGLGVYFCRLESAGQTLTKKIVRVR